MGSGVTLLGSASIDYNFTPAHVQALAHPTPPAPLPASLSRAGRGLTLVTTPSRTSFPSNSVFPHLLHLSLQTAAALAGGTLCICVPNHVRILPALSSPLSPVCDCAAPLLSSVLGAPRHPRAPATARLPAALETLKRGLPVRSRLNPSSIAPNLRILWALN
jgi:hypothetical protein